MVNATGQKIYAVLQEVIDERQKERQDDFISMFLDAEVDGHRLTNDDVLDIGYLFFIAGLDTVTASLDCMLSYLAQNPEQREQLVEGPVAHPARGRGDAALGVAGAGRGPDHDPGDRDQGLPHPRPHEGVGDARLGQHRRAHLGRPRHRRLRAGGQQAHRLRRRGASLPRVAPGPHGAARGPRGVAQGHPRVLAQGRHRAPVHAKAFGPSRTWSWSGEHPPRRAATADRRQARRRQQRRHVRQHQPRHRSRCWARWPTARPPT